MAAVQARSPCAATLGDSNAAFSPAPGDVALGACLTFGAAQAQDKAPAPAVAPAAAAPAAAAPATAAAAPAAPAAGATCDAKAVDKNGKPLAGAAKTSSIKKCEKAAKSAAAPACAAKAIDKNGKPLAGAAKNSFIKKCEKDAKA
jgi:hypothetical protein